MDSWNDSKFDTYTPGRRVAWDYPTEEQIKVIHARVAADKRNYRDVTEPRQITDRWWTFSARTMV